MADHSTKRILIVDDLAAMRRVIRNILMELGYRNITEADSGASALDTLQKEPFDLIIADWSMTSIGGLDLLKAIRADERLQKASVLMVTADSLKAEIQHAIPDGGVFHIGKPLTAEALKERMDQIF